MITIKTNNVPRDIIEAHELPIRDRKEFDYLNWDAIDSGNDTASFFRYKGTVYDLNEFQTLHRNDARDIWEEFKGWDGYQSDTYFSGILVKYCDNFERVIVGRYCS